jgi:hypothetical protein
MSSSTIVRCMEDNRLSHVSTCRHTRVNRSMINCLSMFKMQTCTILVIVILVPLFIVDGQLLFNYGLFKYRHLCHRTVNYRSQQYQRALNFPWNQSRSLKNYSIRYYEQLIAIPMKIVDKCHACVLWNILDTFIYALVPFLIILICSLIIIVKICERHRSMTNSGGMCHKNRRVIVAHDHLSILLITINGLFLLMTGPFNTYLILQSIDNYCSVNSSRWIVHQHLHEYLRLLQNSYHALSFIFYCLIGNKFRDSARLFCRRLYRN